MHLPILYTSTTAFVRSSVVRCFLLSNGFDGCSFIDFCELVAEGSQLYCTSIPPAGASVAIVERLSPQSRCGPSSSRTFSSPHTCTT